MKVMGLASEIKGLPQPEAKAPVEGGSQGIASMRIAKK